MSPPLATDGSRDGAPNGAARSTELGEPAARLAAARRILSDPVEATELLAAATAPIGASVTDVRIRSVHERPGTSLSFVYEAVLTSQGEPVPSLLVAHADRRPLPQDTLVLRRDDTEVAVWRFPHDPFLPGLPSAVAPRRVRELLDRLGAGAGEVALRTRAYRPTRRAVVEVVLTGDTDDPGRVLYLKVLSGRRATKLAHVHRALHPSIPVPRVVGVAGEQGILALEALAGPTLRQALVEGSPLPSPDEIVELSRRIAATELRSDRDPRAFADPTRHVTVLARAVPDLAARIAEVADEAQVAGGPLVPVHGDLHDGQLLVQDGHITGVLDVDGAGAGLIVEDAGNLIAHVAAIGEVVPDARDTAEDYAAQLSDAYRPLVGASPLARATAGAWLALATGPYRAQEPGWQDPTRRRILRAASELP